MTYIQHKIINKELVWLWNSADQVVINSWLLEKYFDSRVYALTLKNQKDLIRKRFFYRIAIMPY